MSYTLSSGAIVNYITPASLKNGQSTPPHMTGSKSKQNGTVKKRPVEEDDIEVVNTIVSCLDVISRQRLKTCVKSTWCTHIECFDLESFRQVNGIAENYYERANTKFTSRFQAIPAVDFVTTEHIIREQPKQSASPSTSPKRKTRSKQKPFQPTEKQPEKSPNKLFVRMSKTKKDNSILFQIRPQLNCNVTMASRKMTNKRKVDAWTVKCPLCGIKFCPTEILHDDFMTLIMKLVPQDVKSIEISENLIVRKVKEETPYQNQEVVSIEDDEDEDDLFEDVAFKKRRNVSVRNRNGYNRNHNIFDDDTDEDDNDEIGVIDLFEEDEHDPFAGTENDPVVID